MSSMLILQRFSRTYLGTYHTRIYKNTLKDYDYKIYMPNI